MPFRMPLVFMENVALDYIYSLIGAKRNGRVFRNYSCIQLTYRVVTSTTLITQRGITFLNLIGYTRHVVTTIGWITKLEIETVELDWFKFPKMCFNEPVTG